MSQRHPIQNEAIMFITTNTEDCKQHFANDAHAREAIETLYRVKQRHPFHIYGFVIMPDHCHFLLSVPKPGSISKIMNVYKSGLTFNTGIPKIWQARFHMALPKNPEVALKYIHMNPVEAGFVERTEDYRWSSASHLWKTDPLPSHIAV